MYSCTREAPESLAAFYLYGNWVYFFIPHLLLVLIAKNHMTGFGMAKDSTAGEVNSTIGQMLR